MPNGTRRAHMVTRNGKTFHRGASKIAPPKAAFSVAVLGGATLLAVGVPQVAVGVIAVAGVAVFFGMRSRGVRRKAASVKRKVGKKAQAWAKRRAVAAGRAKPPEAGKPRPAGATPAPPYRRPGVSEARSIRRDGAYLDDKLRPHRRNGSFMPVSEWERGWPS